MWIKEYIMTLVGFLAKSNNKSTVLADRNQLIQFKTTWTLLSSISNKTDTCCNRWRHIRDLKVLLHLAAPKPKPTTGLALQFQHCSLNKAHYTNRQRCHSCFFDLTRSPNYQPPQSLNYTFAFLTEWVLSRANKNVQILKALNISKYLHGFVLKCLAEFG